MLFLIATTAIAVEPYEILGNSELEDRARKLSSNIRCLVCQNENIDSSDSEFAKDIRLFIRDQLVEGRSDREIEEFCFKIREHTFYSNLSSLDIIFFYISLWPIYFMIGISSIFFLFLKWKKGN